MRSFDERIAEISRRSEKIFQERKKRKTRILASCIPLVLCLGLYAAVTLPDVIPDGSDKRANTNLDGEDGSAESWTEYVGNAGDMVEVSGASVLHQVTDPAQVTRIITLIGEIVVGAEKDDSTAADQQEHTSTSLTDRVEELEGGYIILLARKDGAVAEYSLQGSILTDRETGRSYPLTQMVLAELKRALGI